MARSIALRHYFRRFPLLPTDGRFYRRIAIGTLGVLACWVAVGSLSLAHEKGHEKGHGKTKKSEPSNPTIFTTRSEATATIPPTKSEDAFHFVIYGDRTGGVPAGLEILRQAVEDTKLIDPDLVMTVGDLIQGYNQTPEWLEQAKEFKDIMEGLPMAWFPVAGNHDVYWRGPGQAPPNHHESNYETHFGPLWYSFQHKNAGFVVLYSDEGDANTNEKGFSEGRLQRMSDAQMEFLDKALEQLKDLDHVFVFLHHPRWIESRYSGSQWDKVHQRLKAAGNVHAVFAGHIHRMEFGGIRDGIHYYALATTGGHLGAEIPGAGYLHHFNMVTVRPDSFSVAAIPVGSVIDPKEFTDAFIAQISRARSIRPLRQNGTLQVATDGSVDGTIQYVVDNPSDHAVDITLRLETDDAGWKSSFDHQHFRLEAGKKRSIPFQASHPAGQKWTIPQLVLQTTFLGESAAIELPESKTPLRVGLNKLPANYFVAKPNGALRVRGVESAVRVDSSEFELPDGPFTLEAWIRPANKAGYQGIIAKTQSSEYAFFYDEGLIDFSVFLDGKYVSTRSGQPIATDRLSHVAGVFDGKQIRLYVDGKLVDSKNATGSRRQNRLPLWIGADPGRNGEATRPFDGWIDEVCLSSKAIYEGETISPARQLKPTDSSALLLHFDDRFGPFELDHSRSAAKALLGPKSEIVSP